MFTPNTRPFRTEGKIWLNHGFAGSFLLELPVTYSKDTEIANDFCVLRIYRAFPSHNLDRTFGQGVQERLAVALHQDRVVQHPHDALVGLGADEPARALAKFEDRLRQ